MADEKGSNSAQPSEPIFDENWGDPPRPKKTPADSFFIAQDEVARRMDEYDPRGNMFDGTKFDQGPVEETPEEALLMWRLEEIEDKKAELREAANALTEPAPINVNNRQHER